MYSWLPNLSTLTQKHPAIQQLQSINNGHHATYNHALPNANLEVEEVAETDASFIAELWDLVLQSQRQWMDSNTGTKAAEPANIMAESSHERGFPETFTIEPHTLDRLLPIRASHQPSAHRFAHYKQAYPNLDLWLDPDEFPNLGTALQTASNEAATDADFEAFVYETIFRPGIAYATGNPGPIRTLTQELAAVKHVPPKACADVQQPHLFMFPPTISHIHCEKPHRVVSAASRTGRSARDGSSIQGNGGYGTEVPNDNITKNGLPPSKQTMRLACTYSSTPISSPPGSQSVA